MNKELVLKGNQVSLRNVSDINDDPVLFLRVSCERSLNRDITTCTSRAE